MFLRPLYLRVTKVRLFPVLFLSLLIIVSTVIPLFNPAKVEAESAVAQFGPGGITFNPYSMFLGSTVQTIPDGSGGAIVVWDAIGSGYIDIYAQRIDASGNFLWGAPETPVVVCDAADGQYNPKLISDGAGGVIITWWDSRTGDTDIYAQRLNSSGVPQWTANGVLIADGGSNQQDSPSLVSDGSGGAIIIWGDQRDGNEDVYAQRVDSDGTALWTADGVPVATGSGEQGGSSQGGDYDIAADGSGGAIIVYNDHITGNANLHLQKIDSSGAQQWNAGSGGNIVNTITGDQQNEHLLLDSGGNVFLSWADPGNGGGFSDYKNYLQKYDTSGDPIWGSILSLTPSDNTFGSHMLPDGSDGVFLSWINVSNYLFAQRVNSSGSELWTSGGIQEVANNHTSDPFMLSDGGSGFIVTWKYSPDHTRFLAQRVTSSGTVLWGTNGNQFDEIGIGFNASYDSAVTIDTAGGFFLFYDDNDVPRMHAQRVSPGDPTGITTQGFEGSFPPPEYTTGGGGEEEEVPWFKSTGDGDPYVGSHVAQSGIAGMDNTADWLNLHHTWSNDGDVTFHWKVDSEADGDFLQVFLDDPTFTGAPEAQISGTGAGWQSHTINVLAGLHDITWRYIKNGSVSEGNDSGYVDQVVITDVSGGGGGGGGPQIPVVLPGSADDAGYFTKVIMKPDGFPLIFYYGLSESNGPSFAYVLGCNDIDCSTYTSTNINIDSYPIGTWGLWYYKSNGLPSFITRDTALQGTLSRLDCYDANCTSYTFSSSIFPKTGGYYGSVTGAERSDGVPFMAMDGAGMGHRLEMFTCADEYCTSGTRRNLDTSGNTGDDPYVAILQDDRPVVSYHDRAAHSLKLYVCADVSCTSGTIRTLDQSGTTAVGTNSSILIRPDGTPGIAYTSSSGGLSFYSCNDADCTSGSVYSTHDFDGSIVSNPGGGVTFQFAQDGFGFPVVLSRTARGHSGTNLSVYDCYNYICSEGRFRTLHEMTGTDEGIYASLAVRPDGGFVVPFKNATTKDAELYDFLPSGASSITNVASGLQIRQISRQSTLSVLSDTMANPETQNFATANVDLRVQLNTGEPIADTVVSFSDDGDMNWSGVTGDTDLPAGKSVVGNLTSAPGAAAQHSLYVPRVEGSSGVHICPSATTLGEVTFSCSGGYDLSTNASNVSVIVYGGQEYYLVTGLTGTGGISISTAFNIKDVLTRLQVSTASDHTIYFGTINGLTASGDTIQLSFDPNTLDWNLSAISVTDISLLSNNVPLDLDTAPGADLWGVDINTATDIITFTAPTSGTEYIPAGNQIIVKIGLNAGGTNQIVNPADPNLYELHMLITNGSGTETGEVEIPIMDDDTVNVTGYIDTFISFDIDTAASNLDCDAAGGSNPCDSHDGTSDNSGYVVDLGEMSTSYRSDSGFYVNHADGLFGTVNSIWFDLSSNSDGGVAVKSYSSNDELQGPAGSNIPSVGSGEVQINAGDSLYGIQNRSADQKSTVSGLVSIDPDCSGDSGDDYFCSVGGTSGRTIFSSDAAIDTARVRFRVGASPNALNSTGTYTDQLTFIASATF
jgi:hypothetical protein